LIASLLELTILFAYEFFSLKAIIARSSQQFIKEFTSSIMKVHFSETEFGKFRLAKVKAVAALTKTELTEAVFDAKSPVAKSVHYHSLPLLETPQGTIFSSNAIIRFLANSSKSLYGANPHEQVRIV
jgi:hypothetical protein